MNNKGIGIWLARLWAIRLLLHFLLFFLLAYPFFRLFLSSEKYFPLAHRLRRFWGRYILLMSGIFPAVQYEFKPEKGRTYIFTPNHSSYIDIPAITVLMPLYFNFMAKDELRKVPLFGIFFSTIDIAVQRQSAVASHKAFKKAALRLQKGVSLCLFPEGTISPIAPKLGRFKDGAFRLAIENKIDIVPLTLPDSFKRLPDGKVFCTPGRLRVFVHRPISTAHLKPEESDKLKQEVFTIIEKKLQEYESI